MLRLAAELDNFEAQLILGNLYNSSKYSGFQIDHVKAAKWYKKAMKHKELYNPPNSHDVFNPDQTAVKARLVLKQKNFLIQRTHVLTKLGELYFHGRGEQRNYNETLYLFLTAANLEN